MNVGVVGAGKLGLPVALAIESKGHDVSVYDTNPAIEGYIDAHQIPYQEEGLQPLLDNTKIKVAKCTGQLVANSDLIFLAIQTPHDPEYEGSTRIPNERKDFDYTHLEMALADVSADCAKLAVRKTVAVISTCLPGTYNERLASLTNEFVDYVYTPQFIAMGTVLHDYLNPEFNLIGVDSEKAADELEEFYGTVNEAPALRTDITTAEAIKVAYNTFITMKTVLANTWGEVAHKTGANFDDILKSWTLASNRLLSPKYLSAGMGDGGGCHPRDNIALSKLASDLGLSHNIFEDLMKAREDHAEWLANEIKDCKEMARLPVVILGRSFKPETNIETGSPAILISNLLSEMAIDHEHVEDLGEPEPAVYFVATKHDRYKQLRFPKGSVVIDPFRYLPEQDSVTIIHIGNKKHERRSNSSSTETERSLPAD